MSNELAIFAKGGNLPAYIQNIEDDVTKSLAGGSGGGLRISIRGSVWRMMRGNEEIAKNEERAMNVVIVAASPHTSRTFYEGKYVEGENKAPTCWSEDGVTPSAASEKKQATKCESCPQNIGGSGEGDSRACRFSRNIAVVLEGDIEGNVYRVALPAQSIFGKPDGNKMPLQAYAKSLAAHRVPITAVVTEMRFDTASATPKVTFRAQRPLSAEEYENCKAQGESPDAKDAIAMAAFVSRVKDQNKAIGAPKEEKKPEAKSEESSAEPSVRTSKKNDPVEPTEKKSVASVLSKWDD